MCVGGLVGGGRCCVGVYMGVVVCGRGIGLVWRGRRAREIYASLFIVGVRCVCGGCVCVCVSECSVAYAHSEDICVCVCGRERAVESGGERERERVSVCACE